MDILIHVCSQYFFLISRALIAYRWILFVHAMKMCSLTYPAKKYKSDEAIFIARLQFTTETSKHLCIQSMFSFCEREPILKMEIP